MLKRWASLWKRVRAGDRAERELDDEVQATLDLLADEGVSAGATESEARRAAHFAVGGAEPLKERIRDVRTGVRLETVVKDLRYGARVLLRNPVFTLTAALSLAIGIGTTTAIFTVANGLLLRSVVGVADPSSLVDIVVTDASGPGIRQISYPDYLALRGRTTTLDDVYAYELEVAPASLRVEDQPAERTFADLVTPNFFKALGVTAAVGRMFSASDDEAAGAAPVVVLSHRIWKDRFKSDAQAVGQTVRLNGQSMTIVGVAPEDFTGNGVTVPDVWVPTSMAAVVHPDRGTALLDDIYPWLMLGGRLKPGVTKAQASAEMRVLGDALERARADMPARPGEPSTGLRWSVETASPIPYGVRILLAGFLGLLMAIVSVVLMIACANVAGVLLARSTARRQEIAVRSALGAGRARIVRQLLTETLLLFALGGAFGVLLARWLTMLLVMLLPTFPVPVNLSVPLDWRVVSFALLVTGLAALIAGLVPALNVSKADVVTALKADTPGMSERTRLRSAFVIAQVAFSVLLVVTAGLLVKELGRTSVVDQGFDPKNVELVSVDLSMAGYTESTAGQFTSEILTRSRQLPGVTSVTLTDRPPERGARMLGVITVPGYEPADEPSSKAAGLRDRSSNGGELRFPSMNWKIVHPGFFTTLRIPLRAGREITDADRLGAPLVAVVAETTAKRFWPGRAAIGQQMLWQVVDPQTGASATRPITVVGIAGDVRVGGGNQSVTNDVYMPMAQHYTSQVTLLVRGDGTTGAAELQKLVRSIDPNLPVLVAQSLEMQQAGPVEVQLKVAATVAASIGLVGVLLAAIGTYGLTAYAVVRRTREIAIRMSLGAVRGHVVALVLRQGMTLIALGAAIGLTLGVGAGEVLAKSRFGMKAVDPVVLLGATALLAVVGLIACLVPVLRASRVNPMEALRYE